MGNNCLRCGTLNTYNVHLHLDGPRHMHNSDTIYGKNSEIKKRKILLLQSKHRGGKVFSSAKIAGHEERDVDFLLVRDDRTREDAAVHWFRTQVLHTGLQLRKTQWFSKQFGCFFLQSLPLAQSSVFWSYARIYSDFYRATGDNSCFQSLKYLVSFLE